MLLLPLQIMLGVAGLGVGLGVGWWLRGFAQANAPPGQPDAAMIVASLHEVATRMAADVGEHTSQVQAINNELTSFDEPDATAVARLMEEILTTNEQMELKLQRAERRLQEQAREIEAHAHDARTDVLTGLANRRAFDAAVRDGLEAFQSDGTPLSMMILDVDHFKRFNDTYGHQAGDAVLQGVARVLREQAGPSHLVARYGGEEFAIVFPATTAEDARFVAERARAAIAKAVFEFEGLRLKVTSSCGLAQLLSGETSEDLIRRADEALYHSKESGRNCGHGHDGRDIYALAETKVAPAPAVARAVKATLASDDEEPWAGMKDSLTGLYGRKAIDDNLNRRLAELRRGGVAISGIWVRIDDYYEIVRQQGEHMAHLVLKAATQFLKASMRDMDHVARYDEDTFALVLPTARLENAAKVAERLRKAIARCKLPQGVDEPPFSFTVSMGVTESAANDSLEKLLGRVKLACERAALAGGNRSVLHNGQDTIAAEDFEIVV